MARITFCRSISIFNNNSWRQVTTVCCIHRICQICYQRICRGTNRLLEREGARANPQIFLQCVLSVYPSAKLCGFCRFAWCLRTNLFPPLLIFLFLSRRSGITYLPLGYLFIPPFSHFPISAYLFFSRRSGITHPLLAIPPSRRSGITHPLLAIPPSRRSGITHPPQSYFSLPTIGNHSLPSWLFFISPFLHAPLFSPFSISPFAYFSIFLSTIRNHSPPSWLFLPPDDSISLTSLLAVPLF
jgi:hypothetical protein